jgi:hypothetical protein
MVRDLLPFWRKVDAAAAANAKVAAASHALQRSGYRGRSDAEILGEARGNGYLFLLDKLPDSFEVVFLRNAGFFAAQGFKRSPGVEAR